MSCGKVDAPEMVGAPAATAPPKTQTPDAASYVIEFPGYTMAQAIFTLTDTEVARFSLDLGSRSKESGPAVSDDFGIGGAPYPASSDFQLRVTPRYDLGSAGFCTPTSQADLEAVANAKFVPHDAVDINRVRVDFLHNVTATPPNTGVCYGTHTRSGGWKWNWSLTPYIVDTPWVFGPATDKGTGHFELAINAKNVDMVAFVSASSTPGYFLKRLTYFATRAQ